MISSATDQSAIVLTNRKIKTERDVTMSVLVCSNAAGMRLHHPQGTNRAQAQMTRACAIRFRRGPWSVVPRHYVARRRDRTRVQRVSKTVLSAAPGDFDEAHNEGPGLTGA